MKSMQRNTLMFALAMPATLGEAKSLEPSDPKAAIQATTPQTT